MEPAAFPASFAQELMWLVQRGAPENAAYNVPRTRRIRGALDVGALRGALDGLVARHEILRTTYATHGDEVVQVVHPPAQVRLDWFDLASRDVAEREAEMTRLVRERTGRAFDLAREAPFRAALFRLGDEEHVLLIESHHIAFDGWSRDVLFRDLSALYEAEVRGVAAKLPDLPIQYADFAIWQRQHLTGATLDSLLSYWRSELGDAEYVLRLPTDFPRPAVSGTAGVVARATVPREVRDGLRRVAQRSNATTYMTLLAAFMAVLHRYTGQEDVLVGSPSAGRDRVETEGLIGYFANTVVQRGRFAGDPTFVELLDQVRASALGAYDHQDVPFEKLVLELQRGQQLSHSPLFQVVFTMLGGGDGAGERLGDLEMVPVGVGDAATKFDLTLFMAETDDALTLMVRGRADLFAQATMERFLGHILTLLEGAGRNPDERISSLPILTADERRANERANATSVVTGGSATFVDLFERAAARTPEAIAVHSGERSLTYAQLETSANRLANHLRALGEDGTAPVGIGLDRSVDIVVAIIAVMKAGAAYVPLLPEVPIARLAQQMVESGARAVITVAPYSDRFPADATIVCLDRDADELERTPAAAPPAALSPASPAYVLYTSGSTGVPKGVTVTHANIVHYVRAISRVLGDVQSDTPGDGLAACAGWQFAMASTLGADLGNTCLFPALASGATVHVLSSDLATDAGRFGDYLEAHGIDVLKITPSHLQALVSSASGPGQLGAMLPAHWLVTGGEALSWEFAERLLAAVGASGGHCRLLNHYGPTETTVGCSTFEVTPQTAISARAAGAQTVPIGRPLANTSLHVLDSRGAAVPALVPGELYVAGDGVTAGYLNRPDLTAERFVTREETGYAYWTGDRVRRLPSGDVEFLGRADDQVKIRGYRVELGEIERTLSAHSQVRSAAVTLIDGDADAALAAYVVLSTETVGYGGAYAERADGATLREWLAERLPEYMVPSVVMILDRMPLTPSGKIDRRALPSANATAASTVETIAPRTATEEVLAAIWRDVLKKEQVGVTQSFISLGGHSLLAIRVLGKISRQLNVRLPLRALFDAPTIAELAELVDVEARLAALADMSDEDAARLLADEQSGG